jgi:hypothetical protein
MRKIFQSIVFGSLFFPIIAFGQFSTQMDKVRNTPLGRLLLVLAGLVYIAVPIVAGLALLAFFWGLAMYIFNTGNDEQRQKGIQIMIWGIIALFVMGSIWGILAVFNQSFGITTTAPALYDQSPQPPRLPFPGP